MTATTYPARTGVPTRSPAALPPPELRATYPALGKACDDLERLRDERREVKRALDAATSGRRQAEHADIAAAAAAHRNGAKDPGNPGTDKVDADIRELLRKQAILASAIDSAESDLGDAITAHRAEWAAAIAAKIEKRRGDLKAAALSWGDLRHEVSSLESLGRWIGGWPDRPSYTPGTRYMNSGGPEGSRVSGSKRWDLTLDELLTDADGPAPRVNGSVTLSDEAA